MKPERAVDPVAKRVMEKAASVAVWCYAIGISAGIFLAMDGTFELPGRQVILLGLIAGGVLSVPLATIAGCLEKRKQLAK